MKGSSLVLFIVILLYSLVLSVCENLIYATKGGTFHTRVRCDLVLQCTSEANSIFWSFSGVANPLIEDESRYTNMSSSFEGDKKVIVSSLVLSPVVEAFESTYSCNIEGSSVSAVSFTVSVDEDVVDISGIKNLNLTDYKVGDTVFVKILVETCLTEFSLSVYKGRAVVFSGAVTNNRNPSVTMLFPLVVEKTSAGEYGVRVVAKEASTPLVYFNATGSPLVN